MLNLGLSAARQREFHRALTRSHMMLPSVQILTLDRKVVSHLGPERIIDGSVNFASDADTSRSCSLSLYDPSGHIGFGDNDPSDGALFLDNLVRVVQSFDWPGNTGGWVDVPIFTGPVVAANRDANTLAVEALGMEAFALRRAWDEATDFSVNYMTQLIKYLLRRAGETRFDIPDITRITTETTTLWPNSQPWKHAQKLARALDRQLFYDGRGIARLRKIPGKPVYTFTDGQRGTLTSEPQISFDIDDVRNTVWVKGKGKAEGSARLPGNNPFSPARLGRGPENRGGTLLHIVENDHLKTDRECKEHAVKVVNKVAAQAVTVEYSAIPLPHLEEGDLVELDSSQLQWVHPARNFSIPVVGGDMSVSTTRRMVKGRKAKNPPVEPEIVSDTISERGA